MADKCYKEFKTPASWEEARRACVGQNAKLAEPISEAENTFIKDTFGGDDWLGISRCHADSTCLASSFDVAKWTNWQSGNNPQIPPLLQYNDLRALIQPDGQWADEPHTNEHTYICEKSSNVGYSNHFYYIVINQSYTVVVENVLVLPLFITLLMHRVNQLEILKHPQ